MKILLTAMVFIALSSDAYADVCKVVRGVQNPQLIETLSVFVSEPATNNDGKYQLRKTGVLTSLENTYVVLTKVYEGYSVQKTIELIVNNNLVGKTVSTGDIDAEGQATLVVKLQVTEKTTVTCIQ